MMYYNLTKSIVGVEDFLNLYEPMYFTTSENTFILNKTNPYVEGEIERIISHGLKADDIPTIIAWKLGQIDQKASTARIVFKERCNETLSFKTPQYGKVIYAKPMIEFISHNLTELCTLAMNDETELFLELCENTVKNFAATYIFTLMYFLSKGEIPIYDQYAHKALLAIDGESVPSDVKFKAIESSVEDSSNRKRAWKTFDEYRTLLKTIFGDSYKERRVDRSLWVYGHLPI